MKIFLINILLHLCRDSQMMSFLYCLFQSNYSAYLERMCTDSIDLGLLSNRLTAK